MTGQVPTSIYGKGTFQDSTKEGVDSVSLFDPLTKFSEMIISREKMPELLREAIRIAFSGKMGPVHLSYPKDIMAAELEDDLLPPKRYRVKASYFDRKLVIDAANELVHAKNPAMILGSGVINSKASMEVLELAELLNIPVATTPKAKGAFPEDHPLSLGVMGFSGSPVADKYLSGDVDVLLVVGSSLNQVTTSSWDPHLKPSKCLIHINIDPSEIGKNYVADIGLIGDCQAVVNEISLRVLREQQHHKPTNDGSVENIVQFKEKVGLFIDEEKMFSESIPIKPQTLMRELQETMPDDTIVFVDTGSHISWAIHYLQFKKPNFYSPFGLLTMGYATAAAIGGKLAAPDRPVIAISGDGCFQMNGMEVATAVNYDVPVVWIVENNSLLGLVHELQRFDLGENTVSTTFKEIDCAKIAEGLGAKGYNIQKPGELKKVLPKALNSGKPTVIDVKIDPTEIPPIEGFVHGIEKLNDRLAYL
jgi:acetolactate synthase-1/2/3 large subunit